MEEGVTYADLRLPPTPAPQQPLRLPWCWAAISLALLSLLLLLAQIILAGLSFHHLGQQESCNHGPWSMEESPSYGQQTLQGRCQFCPAGWLWDAGRCYYFSSAKKSWEQSREDCCSKGAQLVTIRANTTLVSAPSLACPTPCGHWAVLVTTSRSLSSHPAITSRVSAPWLWPTCPKPSQASRQGAGDAAQPPSLMVWLGLGVPPGSSCGSSPVLGFPGAHSQHEGVPRGTEEGWLQV
ncbi:killer cell lectin-like receptor subfamily B member 1B allele B isoform 1-T1 [Morphnus guianensis]